MAEPTPSREQLIAELESLSHYGRELSEGKSDADLARELARLKTDRQTLQGIFNYKIFGPASSSSALASV